MNSANGYHLVITPGSGSSTLAGTYQIKNVHSGLALDTQNSGTAQGTLAVQATPDSSSTQKWTLTQESSGYYEIKNSASGLVPGIRNESKSDGADALIWVTTAPPTTSGP